MSHTNKILLLFPDGVGIRNYLYTDVFKGLENQLALFHAFDDNTVKSLKEITGIDVAYQIPKYNESFKEKFYRELISLSRLKWNAKLVANPTILTNWKTNHKSFKNKLFYKAIEFFSNFITTYHQILFLEKKYQNSIRKNSFYNEVKSILQKVNPAQLFCSHQRGLQCATIFAAALDLGIKSTTVIYSWDNLPKARMALKSHQYLVWSNYMKEELNLYYPEITEEQIFVTGTPQFECYQNPNYILPKEDFYERYNLQIDKKIICFSGDDTLTSPDDPKYLEDLASELVRTGLDKEFQILLRRCPVDISGRYDPTISKYPNIIKEAAPLWNFEPNSSWTTIFPLLEDVSLLVSTAYYSEVVVNVGSTMAFDFSMFKKPCVYINYDQKIQVNPNWSVQTIYKFQHFKSMPNLDCVIWWDKRDEISIILNHLKFNSKMNQWQTIVLSQYHNSSKNINQILN